MENLSLFSYPHTLSLSVSCRKREVNKKVLKVPEIEVKVSFEIMSLPISYQQRSVSACQQAMIGAKASF